MYNIEFYANRNGQSEILNFLEALRTKSKTSKDARIQYNQIVQPDCFLYRFACKERQQSSH